MNIPLVAMSGKKRSGKDTVGAILADQHGFTRFAFADAVKQAALDINPAIVSTHTGQVDRLQVIYTDCGSSFEGIKGSVVWNDGVREFLQQVGSVMALRQNTFWAGPIIDQALEHIRTTGQGAVITDCRFPWEIDLVRNAGGVIIRMERTGYEFPADAHISETMLDDLEAWSPEFIIDSTPIETLPERVDAMVNALHLQVGA